jgi:hypothetical protein
LQSGGEKNMIDHIYISVLHIIFTCLQDSKVNWALTGSLSFALQGLPVEPHDIDVQTDDVGAYEIERLLAEYVVKNISFSSAENIRSHFGALSIDGINVEIMGNIQKRLPDGTWEKAVDIKRHKRSIVVENMHIPVLSLEYEYEAYIKLGRFERAQMIKDMLARRKKKS